MCVEEGSHRRVKTTGPNARKPATGVELGPVGSGFQPPQSRSETRVSSGCFVPDRIIGILGLLYDVAQLLMVFLVVSAARLREAVTTNFVGQKALCGAQIRPRLMPEDQLGIGNLKRGIPAQQLARSPNPGRGKSGAGEKRLEALPEPSSGPRNPRVVKIVPGSGASRRRASRVSPSAEGGGFQRLIAESEGFEAWSV